MDTEQHYLMLSDAIAEIEYVVEACHRLGIYRWDESENLRKARDYHKSLGQKLESALLTIEEVRSTIRDNLAGTEQHPDRATIWNENTDRSPKAQHLKPRA
jgi:hypothetical protein